MFRLIQQKEEAILRQHCSGGETDRAPLGPMPLQQLLCARNVSKSSYKRWILNWQFQR